MLQGHRDLIKRSASLEFLILIDKMWLCICHDHLTELCGRVPLLCTNMKVMSVY
jgi:hypothetical protein